LLSRQRTTEQWPASGTLRKILWIFSQTHNQGAAQHVSDSVDFAAGSAWLQPELSSTDPGERADAVTEPEYSRDPAAEGQLAIMLADENADVREAAIVSLFGIGGNSATATLAAALGDADPRVREQAVDALGEIGGEIATSLLEQALSDEEHFVREAAAEMLEQLKSRNQ